MIKSRKPTGSALVVVIIIVTLAVLGVLGYVLWNNLLASKDVSNSSEQAIDSEEPKVVGKTYESDAYTFQYPKEDWELFEEHYDVEDTNKVTPVAKTTNWEQTGMGLDAGAQVSVNASIASQSLAALKDDASTFANGAAKDMQDTKVDGVDAFTYNMAYEGIRYHTVFIYNGISYDITYQHADNVESRYYSDGYDMIVASFKFK